MLATGLWVRVIAVNGQSLWWDTNTKTSQWPKPAALMDSKAASMQNSGYQASLTNMRKSATTWEEYICEGDIFK